MFALMGMRQRRTAANSAGQFRLPPGASPLKFTKVMEFTANALTYRRRRSNRWRDEADGEKEPSAVMPGSMTSMTLRGRKAAGAQHGMVEGL